MELLEPDAARIARAEGQTIHKVLAQREDAAIARFGHELHNPARRREIEDQYGLYRRLIRTRRSDYPNSLPQRRYQPVRVAPTDGDIERAKATRAYLEAAKAAGIDYKRDILLQVAGRSPASLRERLSTLKRTQGVQEAWRRIDAVLRDEPGDAKLDALVDHVREVLSSKPDARIVIVAEDNPTTDYLYEALSKLVDTKISRKRRVMRAAEELDVQVALLKDALEEFTSGEANILVAAIDAREGHNLQFADEIIFFALPWSPHDIQQWIGRIDRLGSRGIPSSRTISITPIVTHNSIEARILEVLEATNVFEKSEVYDESEWEAISEAIGSAADGDPGVSWSDAATQARVLGASADEWLKSTKLPPSTRITVAEKCATRLRERSYACPLIVGEEERLNWFRAREKGLDIMLKLSREEYFDIRNAKDGAQSFKTIWYKSDRGEPELIIPDIDGRHPGHRQAFIAKRTSINCPPNCYVEQNESMRRRLHFLDHGSSLHDQILSELAKRAISTTLRTEFTVEYPTGHPVLAWAGQRLFVATLTVDLSSILDVNLDAVLGEIDRRTSKPEQDAQTSAFRRLEAALAADRRWLIELCPPEFIVSVFAEENGDLLPAPGAAAAVLDPSHQSVRARQLSRQTSQLSEASLAKARTAAQQDLGRRGSEVLNRSVLALTGAIESRIFAIDADSEIQTAAAQAELAVAQTLDQKLVFNQAAVRGAKRALELVQAAADTRKAWLVDAAATIARAPSLAKPRYFGLIPRPMVEEIRESRR